MKFDWLKNHINEHRDLWKWGAVFVAVILPSIIVVYCNHENIKHNLTPFNILVVMTIGAGLLVAKLTDVKEAFRVWFPACAIEVLLSIGLIFQLCVHFYVLRGVNVARDAEARYYKDKAESDQKFDLDYGRYERDRDSFERQQSTAKQTEDTQNRKLANLNAALNKLDKAERSGRALPTGTSQSPALVQPVAPVRPVLARPKMPEDVQQEAAPYFMYAGGFEFCVIVLGITLMQLFRSSWYAKLSRQFPALAARLGGRTATGNFTPHADSFKPSGPDTFPDSSDALADTLETEKKPPAGQSRNSLKTRGVNRPHADSQKVSARTQPKVSVKLSAELSGKPRRVGRNWEVLGVLLPDIPGVRYEGKPKRGSIDIRPTEGDGKSYVASLGKKDLARSKTLDQATWFQFVRDKVAAGQTRRSERAFAREGD